MHISIDLQTHCKNVKWKKQVYSFQETLIYLQIIASNCEEKDTCISEFVIIFHYSHVMLH